MRVEAMKFLSNLLIPVAIFSAAISSPLFNTEAYAQSDEDGKRIEKNYISEITKQAKLRSKERIEAASEPSRSEIVRMLVTEKAKVLKNYLVGGPDLLVKTHPVLGELARIQFTITELNCSNHKQERGSIFCNFTAERHIVGGVVGPLAPLADIGGRPSSSYAVKFTKGKNGWYSPDLSKSIFENSAKGSSAYAGSDRSYSGGWSKDTYECSGGHLENKYTGKSVPGFIPGC